MIPNPYYWSYMETSTTFKVCLTPIRSLNPHPKPDVHSLEIAEIYGFQVVVRKDSYRVGDLVFFLPIDTILNPTLEGILFPPDSKIKLHGSRIRQIKIQQFPSQGMIISEQDVRKYLELQGVKDILFEQEKNYMELLNLRKFEPPVSVFLQTNSVSKSRRIDEQPLFHLDS